MPARASKAALDAFIDNQISTLRWSRAEGQRLYSALSRVHAQAVDRLLTNQFVQKYVLHPSAADGALTPYARQAIGARVRELETWATKLYAEEWKHTGVRLQRFAGEQARFGLEFLSGAIPTKVDWIMPSVEALRGIVWSSPMSGAVLGQWASKLKSNVFRTLESSLVDGLVAGETVRDLTRRVMDSTLTRTRHEAEAIARTAAIHTSNQSLAALYAENSDVVEGEQWVATLDDRTCPICGPRDGVVYPLGQSVRPPAHFNCRCVMAPALREPFAGTELRAARPEFGGPGPYRDYVSWLKSQPDPVVLAHVGEEGARALADGSLTSSKRAFQMALAQPPTKVLPTEIRGAEAMAAPTPSRLSDLDGARTVSVDPALEADLTKLIDYYAYEGIEPDSALVEKVGRALSTGQVTVQDYRLLQYELHASDIRPAAALAKVEGGGRLAEAARELLRYRDQFGGYLAATAEDVAAGRSVPPMAMRNLRWALERRNLLVYEGLDLPGGGRVVPPPVVLPPKPAPPKPEKAPRPVRVKKSRIAASVEPPAVTPVNVARDGAVDVDELLSRPEFRAREREIDELLNRLYGGASRSPATRDRLLAWRLRPGGEIEDSLSGDYATVSSAVRKIEEQRIATLKALLGEQLSVSEATSSVGRHLNVENLKVDVVTGDGGFKRRAIGDLLSGNRTVAGLARAAGVYEEALQRTVDALDTSLGFLRGVVDRLVANGAKVARVSKVGVQLERGIRAKFRPPWRGSGGFVFLGIGNGPRTAVHEFGHWIEVSFPQVRSKVVAFLRKRTRGESLVRLMDLFPDANYDALEKTRPDKFYSAYVGKDYGSYGVASKQLTEVLSMGLELFFTDPVAFYRADPEHFRLILSIVRGLV